MNRRNFLKNSSIASLGLLSQKSEAAEAKTFNKTPADKLNIGFIGVGMRGRDHLELTLMRNDCNVVAICDIDSNSIAEAQKLVEKASKKAPKVFSGSEKAYLKMLEMKDLDAVIIATPWLLHTEMAVAAMKAGKYTGVEVCGAFSLDECWQLVNTHEETGTHLFFLENVCYRRDIMAVLNMVKQNLFGELIHMECGYQHDLREVKFNDGKQPYGGGVEFGEKGFSEAKWRTLQSVHRNGDLYPTHGIGPIAQMLDINRGNRFLFLTSTASKSRGLHDYIVNHPAGGEKHPNAKVEWKLGDVITTVVKANNGETIIISHDTNLVRPYSLGFRVQGTRGIWMDVNKSLHLDGMTEKHRWQTAEDTLKKYDHPLWKRFENDARGAGHGGMDFFLLNAFVECAKRNETPPCDVYDAATWLAITPLSEQSIATGSSPQPFPDFTRGRWTERKNIFGVSDLY
jgi:predicted dehydrogenase